MKFPKVISIHCGPKKTQRCQPFHGYNSTRCWVQSNPPEQTSVLASYAEVCSALFGQTIEFFTSKDASQQPSTLVHNSNVLIFLTQMSGGASLNFKTIDIWPRESPFMLYPHMSVGYRESIFTRLQLPLYLIPIFKTQGGNKILRDGFKMY